jgi:hypothetical protein
MVATVRNVTSTSGLRKFQTDGFLSDGVYMHVRLDKPGNVLRLCFAITARTETRTNNRRVRAGKTPTNQHCKPLPRRGRS